MFETGGAVIQGLAVAVGAEAAVTRASDLAALRGQVRLLVEAFDAESLPVAEAQAVVSDVVACRNMLAAVERDAALRVASSTAWQVTGAPTAEDWLARASGTTAGHAREQLETAERLRELPDAAAAARSGELSPAATAVLSDAGAADPAAVPDLIETARSGSLGDLRRESARVKQRADLDPEETYRRLWRSRRLRLGSSLEGMGTGSWQTTVDDQAFLRTLLDTECEAVFKQARAEGRHEPREAYLLDSLRRLVARGAGVPEPPLSALVRDVGRDIGREVGGAVGIDAGPDGREARVDETRGAAGSRDHAGPASAADAATSRPALRRSAGAVAEPSLFDGCATPGPPPDATAAWASEAPLAEPSDEALASEPCDAPSAPPTRVAAQPSGKVHGRSRGVVRVDLEALRRGRVEGSEVCELDGMSFAPARALELIPRASTTLVISEGGLVVSTTTLARRSNALRLLGVPPPGEAPGGPPGASPPGDPLRSSPPGGLPGSSPPGGPPGSSPPGGPLGSSPPGPAPGGLACLGPRSTTWSGPATARVLVHLDGNLLRAPRSAGSGSVGVPSSRAESCLIDGFEDVSLEAAEQVLGVELARYVRLNGVDVSRLVNSSRAATEAQRAALLWEQPSCQAEHCGWRARLEIDHEEEWARRRLTELRSLCNLCERHHRLKTLEGWRLVPGHGVRAFVPPWDPRHPGTNTLDG